MSNTFVNNYASTLASAIGPSATVLPLVSGGGAALSAAGLGSPGVTIILTIISQSNPNTFEIVLATGLSGDNVTVTRHQEGTTALSWNPNDIVACLITRGGLANFVSGGYVLTFNGRNGAVVPISSDYATFYPILSSFNVFSGPNVFNGNLTAGGIFTSTNILDGGPGAAVKFYYAGAGPVAETISGGFQVDGNLNVSGTVNHTSSLRYKEDVRPLEFDPRRFLAQLGPKVYRLRKTKQETVGVIAEELFEVAPELVSLNKAGEPDGVNYDGLTAYLLGVLRDQQDRLDELELRLAAIDDPVRH